MQLSPIVLFVYNRLEHTKKSVEALKGNYLASESELFIYSDWAKDQQSVEKVLAVREYIRTINGFKKVTIVERDKNWGLANNIIDGVTNLVNKFDRVIVLEDDLVTGKYFLQYMNEALEMYKDDENVASIHGYVYPIKGLPETFFIKGADCWGWATWQRAWKYFNPDGKYLLEQLQKKNLTKEFNFNNSYDYTGMLKDQIEGKNNSWAIRWYASAFLNDMYTLYPGKTLVINIGFDQGTHFSNGDPNTFKDLYDINYKVDLKKIKIEENRRHRNLFEKYFIKNKNFKDPLKILKKFILFPLKILKLLSAILIIILNKIKNDHNSDSVKYIGNYKSWYDAKKDAVGYDEPSILEKVKNSILKVKKGEAVYERDSVLFDRIYYNWPLTSILLLAAIDNDCILDVLDFGGSLGTIYFQNREFLKKLKKVNWSIIEQKNFVECGKQYIEDENLHFYYNIDECLSKNKPNILLLASVLQYIEEPFKLLDYLLSYSFKYIVIDRTLFTIDGKERIAIQIVPEKIYKASYVCRLLSKTKIINYIESKNYKLLDEYDTIGGVTENYQYKGLIFVKE